MVRRRTAAHDVPSNDEHVRYASNESYDDGCHAAATVGQLHGRARYDAHVQPVRRHDASEWLHAVDAVPAATDEAHDASQHAASSVVGSTASR